MTRLTQHNEVRLGMSLGRDLKASHWNLMVNLFCWLAAHLAFTVRFAESLRACGSPTASASVLRPSRPSWVISLPVVLRLPFGHAQIITKNLFGMEISGGPNNREATPVAYLLNLTPPLYEGLSGFGFDVAFRRAKLLLLYCERLTAATAHSLWLRLTPTVQKVTISGAKTLIRAAVLRIEQRATFGAVACVGGLSHAVKLPQRLRLVEINEAYCEIAKKRLAQEVLPLR